LNTSWRRLGAAIAPALLLAATVMPMQAAAAPAPASHTLATTTRFYTPNPDPGAITQIINLVKAKDVKDAFLIGDMILTPQAVWLTGGTPAVVQKSVAKTVDLAAALRTVPVLVAYNIPFRDCAQYSAGGAVDAAAYSAWIDGVAKGIGSRKAVVILEPDSLGIIPFNTDINGNAEWCQPRDGSGNPQPGADPASRYAELNGAVDRLELLPNVTVYLDGTHSGWLGVGDAANRLVKAGVQRAQGFFLNISNFQATDHLQKYGTWISSCIAFANDPEEGGWRLGHYSWCASQYYPANPSDFSTWGLTDAWYAGSLGTAVPTTHFVVDTSRNGQGPWTPPAHPAGDAQDWCNPPDRGLGLRPTANTGVALLDAYLWVKIPGQSDGQCTRWDPAGGIDPVRGIADPAAGAWFPAMALELARNANPAIKVPAFIK
jgi:endoglucanase